MCILGERGNGELLLGPARGAAGDDRLLQLPSGAPVEYAALIFSSVPNPNQERRGKIVVLGSEFAAKSRWAMLLRTSSGRFQRTTLSTSVRLTRPPSSLVS